MAKDRLSEAAAPRPFKARPVGAWAASTSLLAFVLDQATRWWVLPELMDPPRGVLALGWPGGLAPGGRSGG